MALAVNIMHGCGPSDEMHHQLQPKNTKVIAIDIAAKGVLHAKNRRYNTWVWLE